jgi:hypothetical protein
MKKIALVVHPTRAAAIKFANNLAAEFLKKDVEVVSNHPDLLVGSRAIDVISDISAVIVLGGDGTILRAAEIVKGHEVPIIGINLGNVGFLAEISEPSISEIVKAVDSGSTWDTLDLAKLESEVFLIGIWKDYDELESSMSMQELTATLKIKRELDYSDKKFSAAMQGVDLDKNNGSGNEWEDMKARVFSKGAAGDGNDILALQGANAERAGFGIGMGLDYETYD